MSAIACKIIICGRDAASVSNLSVETMKDLMKPANKCTLDAVLKAQMKYSKIMHEQLGALADG